MKRILLATALMVSMLVASGCTATAQDAATATVDPTPTATATPTATPTSTVQPELLVVGLDGIRHDAKGEQTVHSLEDGAALVAFLDDLTGTAATGTEIEGPYGGVYGTRYEWPGVRVVVHESGSTADITISASQIGGVSVETARGFSVGTARDELVSAGAWDGFDEDGDGIADYLGFGEVEVPGTRSLVREGQVGVKYIEFVLVDDRVAGIALPRDDFSDL